MKTKIVYILTFDEGSYHYDQMMLSVYSARKHNPDAFILLVTDKDSKARIVGIRREVYKYVDEVLDFDVSSEPNNMRKSRYLKTNLRNMIDGDYLFIDSDTVICDSLEELDNMKDDICAVPDGHGTFFQNLKVSFSLANFHKAGIEPKDDFIYFNSGVMFVRDNENTRAFYAEWHKLWRKTGEKGLFYDQVALHLADVAFGNVIKEMRGEWNCQVNGFFLNYLNNIKILHYYPSGFSEGHEIHPLQLRKTCENIRESAYATSTMEQHTAHPTNDFTENYSVITGTTSKDFRPLIKFRGDRPNRFKLVGFLYKLLK